jgi:putative Mg2+ transporter-C (MgtC) family protein
MDAESRSGRCRLEVGENNMDYDSFLGIATAAALGSLIGLEREVHGQPAGLRTHMILAVGASLAAILSILFSQDLSNPNLPSDPGRIVAQVVSGVGFLGAGAIMKMGITVKGLTTASSLWTTAIVGIACGSQYYEIACFTAIVVLIILTVINYLESLMLTTYKTHTLKISLRDRPGIVNEIREMLSESNVKIVSLNASMPNKKTLKLEMIIRKPADLDMDKVINIVNSMAETNAMAIS